MIVVEYWMKGEAVQAKQFKTPGEAQAFMSALAENPNCEAYGLARRLEAKNATANR